MSAEFLAKIITAVIFLIIALIVLRFVFTFIAVQCNLHTIRQMQSGKWQKKMKSLEKEERKKQIEKIKCVKTHLCVMINKIQRASENWPLNYI